MCLLVTLNFLLVTLTFDHDSYRVKLNEMLRGDFVHKLLSVDTHTHRQTNTEPIDLPGTLKSI